MNYSYITKGTCSRQINFSIDDGKVHGIEFIGGCNGNLKAIAKLLENSTPEYIISTLKGNTCGMKNTSCADQLAVAVEKAINGNND